MIAREENAWPKETFERRRSRAAVAVDPPRAAARDSRITSSR
jgi:hypothetical protein